MAKPVDPDKVSAAHDEYVHGLVNDAGVRVFPGLRELAQRHDIAPATLFRRSSAEDWPGERNRAERILENNRAEYRLNLIATEGVRFDGTALEIANDLMAQIALWLKAEEHEMSLPPDQRRANFKPITPGEMVRLSQAALNAQKVGKLALGDPATLERRIDPEADCEPFDRLMQQLHELAEFRASKVKHIIQ